MVRPRAAFTAILGHSGACSGSRISKHTPTAPHIITRLEREAKARQDRSGAKDPETGHFTSGGNNSTSGDTGKTRDKLAELVQIVAGEFHGEIRLEIPYPYRIPTTSRAPVSHYVTVSVTLSGASVLHRTL